MDIRQPKNNKDLARHKPSSKTGGRDHTNQDLLQGEGDFKRFKLNKNSTLKVQRKQRSPVWAHVGPVGDNKSTKHS